MSVVLCYFELGHYFNVKRSHTRPNFIAYFPSCIKKADSGIACLQWMDIQNNDLCKNEKNGFRKIRVLETGAHLSVLEAQILVPLTVSTLTFYTKTINKEHGDQIVSQSCCVLRRSRNRISAQRQAVLGFFAGFLLPSRQTQRLPSIRPTATAFFHILSNSVLSQLHTVWVLTASTNKKPQRNTSFFSVYMFQRYQDFTAENS
jgi:hypothetical protein